MVGYTRRVLAALSIFGLLALVAITAMPQDRRGVRHVGMVIALVVLVLSIWRMIQEGKSWLILVLAVVVPVWIAIDRVSRTRQHEA
jgi:uncharacterized membrane protein YqjE